MNGPAMAYFSDVNRVDVSHAMPADYVNATPAITGSHQYTDSYQPSNTDFISDDQVNFFDFEPPPPASPFQDHPSSSDHTDPFSSWNNSSLHPLSPPDSALFPSPKNRRFFVHPQAPPNILTSIDPASTRAQYGQVTPPDDETPLQFRPPHGQSQAANTIPSAGVKKRKRMLGTTIPKHKRTRKNASSSGSFDAQNVDLNSPEQVRRLKFLERNRVAASKCRQKKKQWIDKTEAQARELHSHNNSLHLLVDSLKNEILFVKAQVVRHMDCEASDIKAFVEQRPDYFADAIRTYEEYEKNSPHTSAEFPLKEEDIDAEYGKDSEDVVAQNQPSSPASRLEHDESLKALLTNELRPDATKKVTT